MDGMGGAYHGAKNEVKLMTPPGWAQDFSKSMLFQDVMA
jgi:hypothetical protein